MKSATCTRCNRTYASSQSLWNHKQRCKGSIGQGLKGKIISREDSTLPSQIIPDAELIHSEVSDVSNDSDESDVSDELISNASDGEEEEEEEEEEKETLWQILIRFADKMKEKLVDLSFALYLFYKSKDGDLFRKMMHDIEYAKSLNYSEVDSINYALNDNRESLIKMANACKNGDGNELWCALVDSEPGCRVLTGENCACCGGTNILDRIRPIVRLCYKMEHNKLMQEIDEEVNVRVGDDKSIKKLESVADDVFDKYHSKIMKTAKQHMVDDVHEKVFAVKQFDPLRTYRKKQF